MPGKRIQREIHTVSLMIDLYEKRHPAPENDADRYVHLFQYAVNRLERCYFKEEKPACKQCPIHCYQPAKREEIKTIMRWSGPRMLLYHLILAIRHLIDDYRPVPPHLVPKTKKPSNDT
ncbi:nitrous oxide-stimulated promoter family protein [Pectobacteriaceae bacterium CE70]|nr:nitrous oxide-stimulated promoter family protein [Pectobacteriaceae bacterium CE70]WJY09147.1 nitrous oxide-stimulated promoter family protein [Pectobacteriaceae bacterium C80]